MAITTIVRNGSSRPLQVSCGCAEFQAFIDDFTWTARLDFFQTLVSNELVENSPEGWRPLRDVGLATIELQ